MHAVLSYYGAYLPFTKRPIAVVLELHWPIWLPITRVKRPFAEQLSFTSLSMYMVKMKVRLEKEHGGGIGRTGELMGLIIVHFRLDEDYISFVFGSRLIMT